MSPRQRAHHADGRPVIIAAFEPFPGRKRNRAHDAATMLKGEEIGGAPVELADLPVSYAALPVVVKSLLAREPALLLLVGESTNARKLMVERFAVNVAHS